MSWLIRSIAALLIPHDQRTRNKLSPNETRLRSTSRATADIAVITTDLSGKDKPEVFNPADAVKNHGNVLKRLIGETINIDISSDDHISSIQLDKSRFEQILTNLAINARDAMPKGGQLTFHVSNAIVNAENQAKHANVEPGQYVVLNVTDTGTGMPREIRQHIFEPFCTTEKVDKRTESGLATVPRIATEAGGYIDVVRDPDSGTSFQLYFIAAPEAVFTASAIKPKQHIPPQTQGSELVLVCEDNEMVRKVTVTGLTLNGYRVLEATQAHEAMQLFTANQDEVNLLITDIAMPGMTGDELAKKLRQAKPSLSVLFMSGHISTMDEINHFTSNDAQFIQKPFRIADFTQTVRTMLDEPFSGSPYRN